MRMRDRRRTRPLTTLTLFLGLCALAPPLEAADILLTDFSWGAVGDCKCALREAIRNSNSDSDFSGGDCPAGSGADTIYLPAGTYVTAGNEIIISDSTTFIGDGADVSIINQGAQFRIVGDLLSIVFQGVTLRHTGGFNSRRWQINADDPVYLDLLNSRLTATVGGNGMWVLDGLVTVKNSTIDNHTGSSTGIWIGNGWTTPHLVVENSTISNNGSLGAENGGYARGLVNNGGTVLLKNVTVTGNKANRGGGISNPGGGSFEIVNSIISGNECRVCQSGGGPDCSRGSFTSLGNNVFGDGGTAVNCPVGATDVIPVGATSSVLDLSLAANGGWTPTHALVDDSPALDLAPAASRLLRSAGWRPARRGLRHAGRRL